MQEFDIAREVITNIRAIRKEKQISFKEKINLSVINNDAITETFDAVIKKLGNIDVFTLVSEKVDKALSFRVKSFEYFIPMTGLVNSEEEKAKLTDELRYIKGFLKSVRGKLSDERFVNNAPEQVIANERKKEADALAKIKTLEASLACL